MGGCGGWFREVSLNMVLVLLSCRFSSCRFVFIEVFWCRDDDGVVVVIRDVVPEAGEVFFYNVKFTSIKETFGYIRNNAVKFFLFWL